MNIHEWLVNWLTGYKQYIWVDEKTGKVWKIDPNTNTRVEIKAEVGQDE